MTDPTEANYCSACMEGPDSGLPHTCPEPITAPVKAAALAAARGALKPIPEGEADE